MRPSYLMSRSAVRFRGEIEHEVGSFNDWRHVSSVVRHGAESYESSIFVRRGAIDVVARSLAGMEVDHYVPRVAFWPPDA